MLVKFNRTIKFGANPKAERPKTLTFQKQALPQEVPDSLKEDKHFQTHLKVGDISLVGEQSKAASKSDDDDEAPAPSKGRSR